jgi:hypothetical protein
LEPAKASSMVHGSRTHGSVIHGLVVHGMECSRMLEAGGWMLSAQKQCRRLSAGSPRKPAAVAVLTPRLCLNDARSNEENQLLV